MYYTECPQCGSHLDPGEVCDCRRSEREARRVTMDDWRSAGDFDKAAKPGDLVDEEIVQEFVICLPPMTLRSNLVQAGEPSSHRFDPETDRWQETYTTFSKIDGEWVYCGKCFAGKIEEPPELQRP